jgi:chorismate synthase
MDLDRADENPFFCPDPKAAQAMEELAAQVRSEGDSLGGLVEVVAWGLPPGLGEPVFDKLDARLGAALFSIGAVKGVEIGSGFQAAGKRGTENNDPVTREGYASNHAGGVLGGLSSGMELVVRVAVKPIPSISKEQATVDRDGTPRTIRIGGRHDVSAVPRIVPVCEAMVLLTLADFMLFPYPYRLKHR